MAKITCDYEDFEITIPKNITILDAALSQKIDVPYSCQGGVCSSCIGKITSGTGKMLENNILTDSEIQEGLVLACQTVPTSQNISIDFDDV
jgi:ring-1,2-phenylacetyl-CoA epoxidase subunit PaaE